MQFLNALTPQSSLTLVNRFHFPPFLISGYLNGNRRTSCNFPSIFCSIGPSTNTWYPRNRVSFLRRNQDKPLCPCTLLPIRQNVFHIANIYTVKKAYPFPSFSLVVIIIPQRIFFRKRFRLPFYKTFFPSQKLSKYPRTSKPTLSKAAITSSGVAIR